MSSERLSEILKGQPEHSMGFIEAAREGVQAVAPGLTLSNILEGIGDELKQMGAHGAHELSAAMFGGSAFVMYPRAGQDLDQQPETPQQESGGREM